MYVSPPWPSAAPEKSARGQPPLYRSPGPVFRNGLENGAAHHSVLPRSDHLRASSHPAAAPRVLQSTSVVAVVRPGMASCKSSIPSERNSPVTTVRRRDQPKDQRTTAGKANRAILPTTLTGLSCCVDQGASSTRFGVEVGRRVTTKTSASDAASAAHCGSLLTRSVLPGRGHAGMREVGLPGHPAAALECSVARRAPRSRPGALFINVNLDRLREGADSQRSPSPQRPQSPPQVGGATRFIPRWMECQTRRAATIESRWLQRVDGSAALVAGCRGCPPWAGSSRTVAVLQVVHERPVGPGLDEAASTVVLARRPESGKPSGGG